MKFDAYAFLEKQRTEGKGGASRANRANPPTPVSTNSTSSTSLPARADFAAPVVRKVLTELIDEGIAGYYSDYAAAEQATLAVSSVGAFLEKQGAMKAPGAYNTSLKKLNALLVNDEKYQPQQFVAQLKDLRTRVD